MQPPPPLDFVSTETVRQLYAAMPTVFARDIARAKGQLIPPHSVPTLKRERPTDEHELAMMKRRDTGDSKAGTGMPPPATPALAPKSVHSSAQPFAGSVPQAAMPDPARMVQLRQQQAQFQAQAPQVQQPHVSGVRQMSPSQGTNTGVGMGVGVGQPQVQGQQAASHANAVQQIVNSFGPQGLALINQLQDPNNALVKYLVEQIPNFLSLPLQQQLKSMQHAQVRFTIFMSDPTLAYRNLICRILCNRDGLLSSSNINRGRLQRNSNSSNIECSSSNINSSSRPNHHSHFNNCNNRSTTHSKHSSQTWSIPALAGSLVTRHRSYI